VASPWEQIAGGVFHKFIPIFAEDFNISRQRCAIARNVNHPFRLKMVGYGFYNFGCTTLSWRVNYNNVGGNAFIG
jgi:hypothetical protein